MLPFAKPRDREGKLTLTPVARRQKRLELYCTQGKRCAECGCWMTLTPDCMNTATLDHKRPQPAGCAKDDRDENLQCLCWKCNTEKGSRR